MLRAWNIVHISALDKLGHVLEVKGDAAGASALASEKVELQNGVVAVSLQRLNNNHKLLGAAHAVTTPRIDHLTKESLMKPLAFSELSAPFQDHIVAALNITIPPLAADPLEWTLEDHATEAVSALNRCIDNLSDGPSEAVTKAWLKKVVVHVALDAIEGLDALWNKRTETNEARLRFISS